MKSSGLKKFCDSRLVWFGATVIILQIAYSLRVFGLTSESLWIDEGYSLALSTRSVCEIVRGAAADQHPPLYYLLLHFWLLPGRSVFHLRYLSVLIGVLSVAAVAAMGKSTLGQRVGIISTALAALSPMHIWYSQEARMYILLLLFTTLSAYGTWQFFKNRANAWKLLFGGSILALYTHYFAVFIIMFENLVALIWGLIRKNGRSLFEWSAIQVLTLALFTPWLPIALHQAIHHQMNWIGPLTIGKIYSTLSWMVLGNSHAQQGAYALLFGIVVIAIVWAAQNSLRKENRSSFVFLGLWFALPLGIIMLISLWYPIFQSKQCLILLPPLLLLIASAITELPKTLRWLLVAILCFSTITSLYSLYTTNTKHGWREAAVYIEDNYQTGDILYFNPAAGKLTLEVYLNIRPIPHDGYPPEYDVVKGGWEGNPVTAEVADKIMSSLSTKYYRVWLIEFVPQFWDPEAHLASWLERHGKLIAKQEFQGVRVSLYDLRQVPHN